MNIINFALFALFVIIVLLKLIKEPYYPFYEMSPPKRNMSLDLRCEPEIPKKKISIS